MNGAIDHDKRYVRLKGNNKIISVKQQYCCCFYKKNGIYGVKTIILRIIKIRKYFWEWWGKEKGNEADVVNML